MMEHTDDRSADPIVEALRRVRVDDPTDELLVRVDDHVVIGDGAAAGCLLVRDRAGVAGLVARGPLDDDDCRLLRTVPLLPTPRLQVGGILPWLAARSQVVGFV